jgi:hypothetical protein
LWIPINYWPAMRLAFEIILAIPALLFVAALWTGARQRRRMKEGKLFEPLISANRNPNPDRPGDSSPLAVKHPLPDHLSESDFEAALIAVEQARARGDHAAADAMLASLHGQGPPALKQ